jgi:hypothetical protein
MKASLIIFELHLHYSHKSKFIAQSLNIDFRPFRGATIPFVEWKPNHKDERGELMRLSFNLKSKSKLTSVNLKGFTEADMNTLEVITKISTALFESNAQDMGLVVDKNQWKQEIQKIVF